MTPIQQNNERIIQAIFKAVDEVNQQLPKEQRLEKSIEAVLFDRSGGLDSLGLVILIVAVEQKIDEEFGVTIMLADEKMMSQRNNPFQTIEALVNHVSILLNDKLNG